MPDLELFQAALGLTPPWQVTGTDFDPGAGQLDLEIDFPRGARFSAPSAPSSLRSTTSRPRPGGNFFQYRTPIHPRLPRIKCEADGVLRVEAPWARPGSGFTVLFEAFALVLAKEMPVNAIARLLGEHDTRIMAAAPLPHRAGARDGAARSTRCWSEQGPPFFGWPCS